MSTLGTLVLRLRGGREPGCFRSRNLSCWGGKDDHPASSAQRKPESCEGKIKNEAQTSPRARSGRGEEWICPARTVGQPSAVSEGPEGRLLLRPTAEMPGKQKTPSCCPLLPPPPPSAPRSARWSGENSRPPQSGANPLPVH